MYVVAIHAAAREVVIGTREELLGRGVMAREVNWLVPSPPSPGTLVHAQVRHRARAARAEVLRASDDLVELALDEPISAITPGQSLVMYDDDRVLGGAVIDCARGTRLPLPVRAA